MAKKTEIIINNYAGSGQGPLEEISVGREVMRWLAVSTMPGWYISHPDGGEYVDIRAGKVYILYEQDA